MTTLRRRLRICGTGVAAPAQVVTSDALDARLGLPLGTVARKSGVDRRHQAIDETAAGLAVAACNDALERAGLAWAEIDCLVVASATMDQALPFNAALVLEHLERPSMHIAAFDIGASCMSFLTALDMLGYVVEGNRYRHVMLVSADISTFALDWTSLAESAIFGDGAAAAIVRRSAPDESSCLLASRITTYPEGASFCHIKAGGSRYHPRRIDQSIERLASFHMDGKRLYRLIAEALPSIVDTLSRESGMALSDFDCVVPHQASRQAIDHIVDRLAIDRTKVIDIFARYGNQVGASLPTALHHAFVERGVERGESLLLIGAGAGVTLGGIAMVY